MPFHNFSRKGEIIEITIRDQDGRKLDNFKCTKKEFPYFTNLIERKYGIDVNPVINNNEDVDSIKKKEIDWLKTDNDFI